MSILNNLRFRGVAYPFKKNDVSEAGTLFVDNKTTTEIKLSEKKFFKFFDGSFGFGNSTNIKPSAHNELSKDYEMR